MPKIALLTCGQFPDLIPADQKLIPILAGLGIQASAEIWNSDQVDWHRYDALIFRNTWDYYLMDEAFTLWLDGIERLGIKTYNHLATIRKNKHKFYLREMSDAGILIIPSIFIPMTTTLDLESIMPADWDKVILKPAISAGSHLTVLFDTLEVREIQENYKSISVERDLILQQFMPEIQTRGEVSLIFFNKRFSHAVVKLPKDGDFRIQSQFGGKYSAFTPDDTLIQTAQNIVNFIPEDLLYARVDGIVIDGHFYLMELELIEPDLYLDLVPNGQDRFAHELVSVLPKDR